MEHRERREHNDQMAQDIGYMKGLLEGLAGPDGRVTKLEESRDREWWMTYVITPALILLAKFGIKVGG